MSRVEHWIRDGRIVDIDVTDIETVIVSYPLFVDMLTQLGFARQRGGPGRPGVPLMAKRILVTGSRNWADRATLEGALLQFIGQLAGSGPCTVVHGDCPTGADRMAADYAAGILGVTVEAHPADWATHGRAAGPLRNQAMVDLGADLCLAFPLGGSRGTRDCMRRSEAAGIPLLVCEQPQRDGEPR